jgi:Ran GTPase-activating protein (RanGAP) involved in mRNA processing and transport
MKQQEFCQRLGAALKTNTHCREINLSGCSIDSTGAKLLAEGFANNKTLRVVDLSANKIGNDGSQAIAEALMTNCAINEINLLGQPGAFGESCLGKKRKKTLVTLLFFKKRGPAEVWLTMLSDYNISLRKIIWRLDSRKSFPINKLIVRNNTIVRRFGSCVFSQFFDCVVSCRKSFWTKERTLLKVSKTVCSRFRTSATATSIF